mmetsp:Transcript_32279/g.48693  ORF Transcript_32279/g.48693 Transcript_32279/m.48693 type:complete len:87 (-) Transcript_32279:1496-1756(-)
MYTKISNGVCMFAIHVQSAADYKIPGNVTMEQIDRLLLQYYPLQLVNKLCEKKLALETIGKQSWSDYPSYYFADIISNYNIHILGG